MTAGVHDWESYRDWARRTLPQGLVFLGPDPHHAFGFIDLVPRLSVASADRPPALADLAEQGLSVWTPGKEGAVGPGTEAAERSSAVGEDRDDESEGGRSSADLASAPGFGSWLVGLGDGGPRPPVAVFKPSHRLESLAAASGWRLLGPPAGLARRWENKVAFRERAAALGLHQPPGMAVEAGTGFADVADRLGLPFVLQAPHGYSGARTVLVGDENAFDAARASLRAPRLRAASFVIGRPLTLNACVTARGVAASAPFVQVTGEPGLTRHGLGSCGNDWSWPGLVSLDLSAYRRAARAVGEALAEEGYRGLFGLDFVQPYDHGEPWLIEVNPRLVASVSLHAQLELRDGRVPLAARHLMALLDPTADALPLDAHEGPLMGGQLIIHNLGAESRSWARSTPAGAWSGTPTGADEGHAGLLRQLPPLACLLLPPPEGRRVAAGAEWGRVQCPQGVTNAAGAARPALLAKVARLLDAGGWPTSGRGADAA